MLNKISFTSLKLPILATLCLVVSSFHVKAQFISNYIIPITDIKNTPQNSTVSWDIGKNDFYPMPIDTQLIISGGTNGTASISSTIPGLFTYTPNSTFNGIDSFTYQVTAAGASTFLQHKVFIVVGTNNIIKCNYDFAVAHFHSTISISIKDNDYSKLPTAITILTPPLHGSHSILANGNVSYTPNNGFLGLDSFKYQLTQTVAPFDTDAAWVYVSTCPIYTPTVSGTTPIAGGLNFTVNLPTNLTSPFYFGMINDTLQHYSGYSSFTNVASTIQNMSWQIPQNSGSHVGCVYVSDANFCQSRVCFNTSVNNNCTNPPSPAFTHSYLNNQLIVIPTVNSNNHIHEWKISYNNAYVVNPLFQSHAAIDTFSDFYASGSYTLFHKITDTTTHCFDTVSQIIYIFFNQADTISGYVFYDNNLNGLFDTGYELPIMNCNAIHIYNYDSSLICSLITDYNGYFSVPLRSDSFFVTANPCTNGLLQTFPINPAVYHLPAQGHNYALKGFNFGYNGNAYQIKGNAFFDLNSNNVIDHAEPYTSYLPVSINHAVAFTDSNGYYSYFTPLAGSLPMSLPFKNGFQSSNINLNVVPGYIQYPVDLSYLKLANAVPDLGVHIIPLTNASINDSTSYLIQVSNQGNKTVSGSVTLKFNANFHIVSSSPNGTINTANNVISWSLPSVFAIGAVQYYKLTLSPTAPLVLNSVTHFYGQVFADSTFIDPTPNDNFDTLEQLVYSNSLSNLKTATPIGQGTNHRILPESSIIYTIHFSNNTNHPSINVVLIDTLDEDINPSSFEIIGSSHSSCVAERNGSVVKWVFNDILLPSHSVDPVNSEGFVTFKVKLLEGLPIHKKIHNTATIYFSGEAAIRSNTTLHTLEYFLTVEETTTNYEWSIFPNPMSSASELIASYTTQEKLTMELISMDGKLISKMASNTGKFSIQKGELSPGIYLVTVRNEKQLLVTKKIAVQ